MGILDTFLQPNVQGEGIGTLPQNPLFNMGMNLLAANYDPNINPWLAAARGITSATDAQTAAKEQAFKETQRELEEKERQRRIALGQSVSGIISEQTAMGHPGMMDGPGAEMTPQTRALGNAYSEAAQLDPMGALRGWQSHQQSLQQGAASQAATASKTPWIDSDGKAWIIDSSAPNGRRPLLNDDGTQMMGPEKMTTLQLKNGAIIQVSKSKANEYMELIGATEVETGLQDAKDVAMQRDALRILPGAELSFAAPNSAWALMEQAMGPEFEDMREDITGLSYAQFKIKAGLLPGGKEAEFQRLIDRIHAGAFLQAAKDLAGSGATLGQITEVEGLKMQIAAANLESARNPEELMERMQEYKDSVKQYMIKLRTAAGYEGDRLMYNPDVPGAIDFRSPEQVMSAQDRAKQELDAFEQQMLQMYGPQRAQ